MIGAAIGAGLGQAVAGTVGNIVQGEYQKALQKDQQNFIREQSQNQIKYNVEQMKELGYSPSMLFSGGGGSPTSGGAGGGGQGKAPDFAGPILQAVNTVGNLWMKDKELDNKEKLLDLQGQKIVHENSTQIMKQANEQAQREYWEQKKYNLDPAHPLNTYRK